MKNSNRKKFNLAQLGLGVLILFFALIILFGFSAWQNMVRNGDESNAVHITSLVQKLQSEYASTHQGKFADSFEEVVKGSKLEEEFSGQKSIVNGYIFEMKVEEATAEKPAFYSIRADPQNPEGLFKTLQGHFYYDSTLRAIKGNVENRQANADDPSI